MANWGAGATGALSGAAAGSVIPVWGTAAGAVIGGVAGLLSGDGGAANQQQLALDQLQQTRNQQQYAQLLTAEALKRSTAGSVDAQGSGIRYDPGTNSWVSTLGNVPAQLQSAQDQANLLRNKVDIPQATANNIASSINASEARHGLSGAVNNYNSYVPESASGLQGALQDASTRANQVTQDPIIADTLRQFARTGTAAGPVLAQLEGRNATTLAQEMDNNVIQAKTGVGQINASNRAALAGPVGTLSAAGTPNMQFPSVSGDSPSAQLAAQVNGRAQGSATPATQGAYSSAVGSGAGNQAAKLASDVAMNSPVPGYMAAANQSIQTLGHSINGSDSKGIAGSITDFFNSRNGQQVGGATGTYGPTNPNGPRDGTDISAFMGTASPIPNNPNTNMWGFQ